MSPNTQTLIEVAKARRTYYALGRNAPVPDSEVVSLVNEAILHIPSSFNTQSTRLVVTLGADHEKVWDIAAEALKGLVATGAVTQETFDTQTKPKLDSFKAAYGTVRFYFVVAATLTNPRRFSFTKTPPTSSPCLRSSLPLLPSSPNGPTTPTPCTNGSVSFSSRHHLINKTNP